MTSLSSQNIPNQLTLDSSALAQLYQQIPQASNLVTGSYFIKSWKNIHGYHSLHVFYNYNTNSFWAVLQDQAGLEFIPSMKDGFEMITVPILVSKMTQNKLINPQSPFTSSLNLVGFLQKELRYPIIKDTSNGQTIQLNCAGLLGGGAKVSRVGIAEVTKQNKVNKDSEGFVQVKRYLINRYKIHTTQAMDTNDEKFVEKLAERICIVTSFDQVTEKHLIEKNLNELIDVYEEEYFDEVVLEIIKKSIEGGKPQLKDYLGNFCSGRLCIELLRKGYYATERAKGGVSQLIVEKILVKLTEETEAISKKLQQKLEGDDDKQLKPVIFEKLFTMLEMREKINSFLKPLAKIKVKKLLSFVSAQLEIETEDQTEIITEFCCSEKSKEIYDEMSSRFLMMGTRAFSASLAGSPKKSPEKQEVPSSERPSRNLDESPEAKKKTDSKASDKSENDFPYLNRVRLSVLNELNLLDHELGTLVELHNMLKAETTVVTDKSDNKGSSRSSKNSNLDDIKGLILSIVRGYRENEANLESHELDSLLPLAFIQDAKIFRSFLQVFLEDLSNDILFDAKKVRVLSFILISAMRNPDFKDYIQTDDLIQCLKILKPKIEDLSITSENINIQEAMSSLNDILFLMGFIGAKGVKGDYLEMVKELTKHMQSHGLEKTFNAFTGKAKDPSLDIKREYALESFKRIEGTSFEEWEGNFQNLMQIGNIAINLGKGIFLSDMSSISEALLQIADLLMQAYLDKPKCWYDHCNDLRFLALEPIEKIIKELFESDKGFSQKYSFYTAEFLLAVIAQPARKIRDKKLAAQALWFLTHGYDYKVFKTQRYLARSRTFRFDKDICTYVMNALTNVAKSAEIDFSIFVRKVIETPFKPEKLENTSKIEATVPTKSIEKPQEESPGKRFYVKMLMEKKPKLYALARIQERSEKALEKPSILVDFRGIDKEKDCEESFVRKLKEKAEGFKSTNISDQIQNLRSFDAEQATKKTFADAVNKIALFKGEFKQEQEKTIRTELLDTINTKAKEINDVNTSDLLEVLEEFLVNPTKTVLLIQGDAGAGKTLLLRLFEQRLWKKYNMLFKADVKNRNRLPLRIALSEVRSFDKAVDEFLIQNGCDAEAVFDIKKEPAVILFDGYDEINQYINLYNLNKLESWRDVKVIFTSRKENLTSLKEDYLLCFTPGTDKSKVLSYSIQPVNEDQIRKYFNAQVSENEHKISKLEDELKVLNGTETGEVTISKTLQREVTWLQKFPTSEHYNCMCELLGTLEDHLPEIEDLQEEIAGFKDSGVEVCQLTEVFEKQIAELTKLTDKAKIEVITKKIGSGLTEEINQLEKMVDSCLDSLENNITSYHSANYNIKNFIKRLKKLTNLKRASHLHKKITEQVEQSISESETTLTYMSYAESAITDAKSFEEKTSLESLKKQNIAEEIEKFKAFNKKIKSSALPTDRENVALFNVTEAERYLTKIKNVPQSDWEKISKNWKKLYEKMEEFKALEREVYRIVTGQEYKPQQEQQEEVKPEESKPEEEVKPEKESKSEEQLKPEEVKPEEESKPEEPKLEEEPKSEEPEGEPKPDEEVKPEEESKPEEPKLEESKPKEQSKLEETKPEEPKPKEDPQPPQGQADEAQSVKKHKIDHDKLKEKVAKMKDAFDKMKEICKEFKIFDVEDNPTFVNMDNDLFYNLLWNKSDEDRGVTESEMYEIQSQSYMIEANIRCFVSMHTEIESVIRNVEVYIEYINPLCYHSEAGSLIQKFTEKIEEVQENLDKVKGPKVDHNEGSEVVQILQKQITILKGVSSYLDTQRIIQKLDDIINDIKALENESKAVKEGVTDEAIRVKALLKQIRDLRKFTDSDNLESIIQKFKDIITSPFMLKMLLQTLLKFPKSTANRAELYRLFSTIHFEREKDKLLQSEKIPPKFNVIDSFYQYSKDLAVNMFIKKVASLQAKSNGYKVRGVVETVKKLQWSRFFDDDDIITKLARRGAQIIEDDGTVRFIHKSILEYFAARQFYDEIVDYNPENQEEAYDPCLNKGVLVDNETAVYHFMKNIAETDPVKNDKDLTIFDKKLLETLNSPVLEKDFGSDFNKNLLYPNMFLLVLMRKNLAKKLVGQKEDSLSTSMINRVLKWMFTETTDSTRRFIDMLCKIKAFDGELFVSMNHLLKIYYHHATKEHGGIQFKERFVTSKRKLHVKVAVTDDFTGSSTSLIVKDKTVTKNADKVEFCWVLDGKLFIHDSQDNIVVLKADNHKYLAMATDTNKDTANANAKPENQASEYVVVETEHPWDVKECKWILRMNQHNKTQFELMSLTDSTKMLSGSFDKLEEYNKFWENLCETDIHLGSISDTSYQCKTCNIISSQILCKNCIDKCHKGHEIIEYGGSGGYCDCRFLGCCELVTGCTVRFPDGYRNPVMFKCTQCPNEKRKILCLSCKKHHEKEHQNFEKVVDAEGCECDCPSNKCKIIAYAQDRNFIFYLTHNENNNNQENDGEDDDDDDSNPNN